MVKTVKKTPTKAVPKTTAVKKEKKPAAVKKAAKYFEALGRRKTSNARVRLSAGQGENGFSINGKPMDVYFPTLELKEIVFSPLRSIDLFGKFGVSARVKGGGVHSQAEAVRHGIAKALVSFDSELRKTLKKAGFLTRDPRMRERKKFGLKRARRAPQWAKR